jgi:hypothetical protein
MKSSRKKFACEYELEELTSCGKKRADEPKLTFWGPHPDENRFFTKRSIPPIDLDIKNKSKPGAKSSADLDRHMHSTKKLIN